MRAIKFILVFTLGLCLMGNTSCNEHIAKTPIYIDSGKDIVDDIKDVDTSGNTINDIKNYVDVARDGAAVIGTTVPGTQVYTGIAVAGLTVISGVLGLFAVKKTKEVKIHKARSDNYREGITNALADGGDQDVADVKILKETMDKDTKAHFNETGATKL